MEVGVVGDLRVLVKSPSAPNLYNLYNLYWMKLYNRVNNDELKQRMLESHVHRITLSFYQYANIDDSST